jgi:hypothetical protein
MLQKIKGYKKITAAAIGLIAAILGDYVGVDSQAIESIVQVLGFYLIGQGASDLGEHVSKNKH